VPFMLLDIEESAPNRALAMEKALTRPQSQRRTAKPVLRGEQQLLVPLTCGQTLPRACSQCKGRSLYDNS